MVIREAGIEDLVLVVSTYIEWYEKEFEDKEQWPVLDAKKVVSGLIKYLSPGHGVKAVLLAHVDGEFAGMFVLDALPFFFHDGLYAQDRFVYVVPKFRQGPVALGLLGAAKEWSLSHGCVKLFLNVVGSRDNQRLARRLTDYGMRPSGSQVVCDL